MKKNLIIILTITLSFHLLYSNFMLLHEQFIIIKGITPNLIETIIRLLFALSYSIITAIILNLIPKPFIFVTVGLIDGFGVTLKYLPIQENTNFLILLSIYFGIYTTVIIIVAGLIQKKRTTNEINKEKTKPKTINLSKLYDKKISLQNSINRLKNENKRKEKQKELEEITNLIKNRNEN